MHSSYFSVARKKNIHTSKSNLKYGYGFREGTHNGSGGMAARQTLSSVTPCLKVKGLLDGSYFPAVFFFLLQHTYLP